MSTTPKRALIYCRVSSRAQEQDGHGLQSQESRCRDHAAARGYEVVAAFPDTITGGGDFMQRPGMKALLTYLDAQPDENFIVIFDDLKRLARDTRAHLDLREAFRNRGATIECLNFRFDDSFEGEFLETVIAAQGALERKQNGRQVAQKMKARMEAGYWIHNPPVGYRYTTKKGFGKVLVPNPPFDGIIREAFEGFALGRFATQAEVKRFFESLPDFPRNKRGQVTNQRVADILSHPAYTGYICSETYGIQWLKAQHQALVPLETFDKVQERRKGASYAPQRKNIGDDFALRGIACCAGCDVPLRSSWVKGRTKQYAYYLCQTKGCDDYGKSIARDKIEGDVGALLKTLQPKQSFMAIATTMFRLAWNQRQDQAQEVLKAGQREIKDMDRRSEKLMERIMHANSETMIPIYEGEVVALDRGKAVLMEQMAKQAEPQGSFEEKLEPALTFLTNPWKLWETGHVALRRTVLKYALTGPLTYCRNEGARTPDYSLPFKALGGLQQGKVFCGAGERT